MCVRIAFIRHDAQMCACICICKANDKGLELKFETMSCYTCRHIAIESKNKNQNQNKKNKQEQSEE